MNEHYLDILGKVPKPRKNSKAKGTANENNIVKMLKKWSGVEFARVPASGGLDWKNSGRVSGDIICTDESIDFPFSIEAKHYSNITILTYPDGTLKNTCTLHKFMEQAVRDAVKVGKMPMLITKVNKQRGFTIYIPLPVAVELDWPTYMEVRTQEWGTFASTDSKVMLNNPFTDFLHTTISVHCR